MQQTIITGHLGKDAQTSTLPDGSFAINFSLADSYKYNDKETGEEKEKTTWFDCSFFRKSDQSTKVAEYLKKGTKIFAIGKLTASNYTNKNGKVIPYLKFYVEKIELMSAAKESYQQQTQKQVTGMQANTDFDLF